MHVEESADQMKLAIHHRKSASESEQSFIDRLSDSAKLLGWTVLSTCYSSEINKFEPDFVIAVDGSRLSKLTRFPTYGMIMSVPKWSWDQHPAKCLLSHDGYLAEDDICLRAIKDYLYLLPKQAFVKKFEPTVEALDDLVCRHRSLCSLKGFVSPPAGTAPPAKSVQLIVRAGRNLNMIQRALDSIAAQSFERVSVLLVAYKAIDGLSEMVSRYEPRLGVQVIDSTKRALRSTQLWDGLAAVTADYFGLLDDDDLIYPNHLTSLYRMLEQYPLCGVAFSGATQVLEYEENAIEIGREVAILSSFLPFDMNRVVGLESQIQSNSFLARRELLAALPEDPELHRVEDTALLLWLSQRTQFCFSYEITCQVMWRADGTDNISMHGGQDFFAAKDRLKRMFWMQPFPSVQTLQDSTFQMVEQVKFLKDVAALMQLVKSQPLYKMLKRTWSKPD